MAQLNHSPSPTSLPLSEMAEHLIGSEIIKLGNEIRERLNKGEHIYNFTIGDFDPKHFPIPVELKEAVIACYEEGFTNYPVANGYPELRKQVSALIRKTQGLDYSAEEILIAGGARPVIYAAYRAILDPGDKVVFPVPSWNNNHYAHLAGAQAVMIETEAENHFMPTAASLAPNLAGATLLALCSPLNPTGTAFTKAQLEEICDLVVAENARRKPGEKPLYLLYDQIYNLLTFGDTEHVDPVSLRPEMRPYTLFVDGISKSLAATGVRVGWCFGPEFLIDKMKSILGHVGAWAPRPEQIATARYFAQPDALNTYLNWIKKEIHGRLLGFYNGISALQAQGYPVEAVAPQGAIYLTIRIDLTGKKTTDGRELKTTEDTTAYLLSDARLAVVPFYAFGSSRESRWYRLSVGTASMSDMSGALESLRQALEKLS